MSYYYTPSMGPGQGAPANGMNDKQGLFPGGGQPPSLGQMYAASNMTAGMSSRPSPLGPSLGSSPSYPGGVPVSYGQSMTYANQPGLVSQGGLYSPYAQQSLVQSQQRGGLPSGLSQPGSQSMLGASLQQAGLQPSGLPTSMPTGMPQPGQGMQAGLSSNPYMAGIPNSRAYSGLAASSVYPGTAGYSQAGQYGIAGGPPSGPSPTYAMNRGVPSYPSHLQAANPSYQALAQGVPSMGPQGTSGFPAGSPYGGPPH